MTLRYIEYFKEDQERGIKVVTSSIANDAATNISSQR